MLLSWLSCINKVEHNLSLVIASAVVGGSPFSCQDHTEVGYAAAKYLLNCPISSS